MTITRERGILGVAVLLPVLAIVGLIARANNVLQSGTEWRVPITGYDPRDLLRGHYLVYRLGWQVQTESCQGDGCCYCLWNPNPNPSPPTEPAEPAVSVISCADRAPCQSYFHARELPNLEKFYIPETDGTRLEEEVRNKKAALLISVSPRGRAGIKDLLLDGRPFREILHGQ